MNEDGVIEGKMDIWIKSGKFSHRNDLYVKVEAINVDEKKRQIWKTDEKDSSNPQWDSTVEKHVKGKYVNLIFSLMDEDTFSRDDLLGSAELPFSKFIDEPFDEELELFDADSESIGHIDISVKFEPGDVNTWDLAKSRLHESDSD